MLNDLTRREKEIQLALGIDKIQMAIEYYHAELKAAPEVKAYLKSRGVSKESVIKHQLGYAPSQPKIGKRFHDRLIFPIHSSFGHPVGWTGRTLINAPAKYINVKESAKFQKGRLLYLYHLAKPAIIKTGTAILVEGQMDALILHQYGLLSTVASSGVAFKPAAARTLARYAQKVYIVFDADDAGKKAQLKAQKYLDEVYLDNKIHVVAVNLPDGEDPASFMLKYGKNAFLELLRSSNAQ